jgi:hypothetical protein
MEKDRFTAHAARILAQLDATPDSITAATLIAAAQLLKDYAPTNEYTPFFAAKALALYLEDYDTLIQAVRQAFQYYSAQD